MLFNFNLYFSRNLYYLGKLTDVRMLACKVNQKIVNQELYRKELVNTSHIWIRNVYSIYGNYCLNFEVIYIWSLVTAHLLIAKLLQIKVECDDGANLKSCFLLDMAQDLLQMRRVFSASNHQELQRIWQKTLLSSVSCLNHSWNCSDLMLLY